jgi:hypothetical protein
MEEKFTIRGTIDKLNVSETAEFDRDKFRPSTIRMTCSHIKIDTFKTYRVYLTDKKTIVERIN